MIYHTSQLPGREVTLVSGQTYLWFSGTDYLGMGQNESFKKFLHEGFEIYGTHFGSSRNNSLRLDVYEKVEDFLAKSVNSESALTVSSGFWAGQLLHKELNNIISNSKNETTIQYHYAPGAHPAIWGDQYVPSNLNWTEWALKTVDDIAEYSEVNHVICTDSVGSPWVEKFDLSIFSGLPDRGKIWLIVDDSHGLGVIGTSGLETYQTLRKIRNTETIVIASLNKAMGISGGVIFSSKEIYQQLRNSPWFSGASPSSPAYMYALKRLLETGEHLKSLEVLQENIRYFHQIFDSSALFTSVSDYPILCSRSTALFDFLFQNGILASCFSYPLPTDAPVSRVAISSTHQKKDLDKLAEVCMKFQ